MKVESTDVVGGRCMRGNDVTLYFNETSKIMNEENEWDHIADTVEGPMGSDCRYCRGTNGIRLQVL